MTTYPRVRGRLSLPLAALACSMFVGGSSCADSAGPTPQTASSNASALRVLVAMEGNRDDVRAGVTLGESESRHTLALLNRSLDVEWARAENLPSLREMFASARVVGYSAAIIALDPAEHEVAWDRAGLPVLALMQVAAASPWLFRVRAAAGTPEWQPTLERFGAGELNARFRRQAGRAMTGDAWCGWVAVKAIAEAALHARSTAPADVAEALRVLRFDGHKGEPLYFDEQQRLVQPVYPAVN